MKHKILAKPVNLTAAKMMAKEFIDVKFKRYRLFDFLKKFDDNFVFVLITDEFSDEVLKRMVFEDEKYRPYLDKKVVGYNVWFDGDYEILVG